MRKREWTKTDEEELLRLIANGYSWPQAAKKMNKPLSTICFHAKKLNLTHNNPLNFWSKEEEEELLRLKGQGLTYQEISEKIGRTRAAVARKARHLQKRSKKKSNDVKQKANIDTEKQFKHFLGVLAVACKLSEQHQKKLRIDLLFEMYRAGLFDEYDIIIKEEGKCVERVSLID